MLDYLQKFSALPKELRDEISSQQAMVVIDELEKKYKLNLVAIVLKIMIKDIKLNNLADYLVSIEKLDIAVAKELAKEFASRLFYSLSNYLGLTLLNNQPYLTGLIQEKKVLPIEQLTPVAVVDREIYTQQPTSEDTAVKGASFFFSPDDETEIRELTKKINNYSKIALPEEALLDQIISKAEINFGSDALAERFKQILKIYLRGIRNKIETKQTLIKPFENGGLSFDETSAEQVLFIVDDRLKNSDQLLKPKPLVKIVAPEFKKETVASLKDIGARDFEYDLATIVKQKKDSEATTEHVLKKDVLKKIDTDHELAPLCPAVVKAVKPVEIAKKPAPQSLKKDVFQKNINLPIARIKRPRTETDNKIKMEDVKFVPRVMGPIDELRYLDLINFRRLSLEAGKAIEKIKEKINLLEDESYTKRLDGIKAWRSCPVSKLYLDIGQSSISANKPIDVIIEERKKRHEKYLTSEEFEAIVDLNKSLRF